MRTMLLHDSEQRCWELATTTRRQRDRVEGEYLLYYVIINTMIQHIIIALRNTVRDLTLSWDVPAFWASSCRMPHFSYHYNINMISF